MQMSEIESAMYLRSDQQSLVPTSGLQPDLKELGTFSGTPTRILVTLTTNQRPYSGTTTQTDVGTLTQTELSSGTPTRPKGTWSFLWDSNPDSRTLTQTELRSQTLIPSTVSLVSDHVFSGKNRK